MPSTVRVFVSSLGNGFLPPFTGGYVRGVFYSVLSLVDKELADSIHNMKGIKPFSVSPLRPFDKKMVVDKSDSWVVEKGDKAVFEVKFLSDQIMNSFLLGLMSINELTFGRLKFEIEKFDVEKREFRDFLRSDYGPRIGITFHTPTLFNIRGRNFPYLLPDLKRMASNLVNIWNATVNEGLKFPAEPVVDIIAAHSYIKSYNLYTREVKLDEFKVIGFKGKIEIIVREDSEAGDYLSALLSLAKFSNIGEKRTYGLGVVSVTKLTPKGKEHL